MDAIKVLVTNQKGGVGKSTIAANLAAYLAIQNNVQVKLIDFDRQSSSSKWISRAPDIGLNVHHVNLAFEDTGSLVLAQAKRCLNKYSVGCDISILDKYRIEQKRNKVENTKTFSSWIPNFLVKK
ncbi:AAA family ATPase [Polynucleobacter asymbioticus]|jgi:cellulose biosynthesis protein BcsQ|uniref:CobQ/CobB/MinD/ParA nucleotide binding domain-containing protein n=1 Tax=Polynucleobacter asymbioticus TaxID=576611 RepID=A0AAC9NHS8_9BURK|nr:AAA family ATPase [Polynucleobacter asymbioticus]APB98222.1 hypothetical protein A4F89_02150 [Polynucleobacter asymbioticus]APC00508.1 hypothetical protein AOC25_02155 [Polynucleobacter asymbioticus]